MPVRDEVINWFEEAKSDLRHAKNSIDMGDYNWACFAAHQAVEKALKSLILHIKGIYPKGHDLVKLYNIIKEELALEIDISLLPRLSAYYVQTRYPNAGIERPSIEFNKLIAEEALNISEMIINEVSKALKDP